MDQRITAGDLSRRMISNLLPPAWRPSDSPLTSVSIGVILVKVVGKRNPEHTCVSTALSHTRSPHLELLDICPYGESRLYTRRCGPVRSVLNRRPIFQAWTTRAAFLYLRGCASPRINRSTRQPNASTHGCALSRLKTPSACLIQAKTLARCTPLDSECVRQRLSVPRTHGPHIRGL